MIYHLLLTNQYRARWLWWGLAAYLAWIAGMLSLRVALPFWAVAGGLPGLLLASIFYDRLFRQPGWVLVATDGIAWANPADASPISFQFAAIRTYRFEHSRNGTALRLYLHDGQKIKLNAAFSLEYAAMQQAVELAVRRYNQTQPAAPLIVEKTFFERPISTKILLGLLTISAGWVARCASRDAPPAAYVPLVLLVLPYLSLWAGSSGQRE